jgi:hypothetical protein
MSERLREGHDMCAYIIIAAVRPLVRDTARPWPRVRDPAPRVRDGKKVTGKSVSTDRKN